MRKHSANKTINPIEKHFSVISRYHYLLFFILFLSKWPVFWHFISIIFLTPRMDFNCDESKIKTSSVESKNSCPCDNPIWNTSIFTNTIQMKFDLYCERQWLVTLSQSMLYVGSLIGSLGFGIWSDRYGRLSACCASCLLLAVSGCLLCVMPSITSFIIMRSIEGAAAGGYIVAVYVFCVEFCGPNNREVVTGLFHLPPNFGHFSVAGVSYLLRNCDHFQLAISIPMFFFMVMKFVTYESPKWLLDEGRVDEAAVVMDSIAKFNKHSSPTIKPELEAYRAGLESSSRPQMKFIEIFKHRRLTINLCCMSVIYFVCGMGFYGVSQYIGQMSGNIHTNVAISGTLLIPGTLAATFLIKILSRRTFMIMANICSGFFIISVISIPYHLNLLRVIFACIGNCFFFMCFINAFLFGVELFPTTVRSSALGFLSLMSRIGQIIAPQINVLSEFAAGLTFGILAIIGALLCFPLPETKNVELPSSLEDTEEAYKTKSNPESNAQEPKIK